MTHWRHIYRNIPDHPALRVSGRIIRVNEALYDRMQKPSAVGLFVSGASGVWQIGLRTDGSSYALHKYPVDKAWRIHSAFAGNALADTSQRRWLPVSECESGIWCAVVERRGML